MPCLCHNEAGSGGLVAAWLLADLADSPPGCEPGQAVAHRARRAPKPVRNCGRAQGLALGMFGEVAEHEPVQLSGTQPLAACASPAGLLGRPNCPALRRPAPAVAPAGTSTDARLSLESGERLADGRSPRPVAAAISDTDASRLDVSNATITSVLNRLAALIVNPPRFGRYLRPSMARWRHGSAARRLLLPPSDRPWRGPPHR